MKWPLLSPPKSSRDIPLYNRYYLHAPAGSGVDPLIVLGTEFEADALLALLQERNRSSRVIITTAHALIRATAMGLAQFPDMNVRLVGRRIYTYREIGVRMAFLHRRNREIDVMKIVSAHTKNLEEIAQEVWAQLLEAARGTSGRDRELARLRKLLPFLFRLLLRVYGFLDRHLPMPTVSRIDGLRSGAAMVNDLSHTGAPPMRSYKPSKFPDHSDALNLTLGPVESKVVEKSGQFVSVRVMPLFIRGDHRLVDAYELGRFVSFIRELLQDPHRLNIAGEAQ